LTAELRLRVITYNVHRCRGLDRRWSASRIADVIASANPDVVALQEVDVKRARSGHVDQAHAIARYLKMNVQFFPVLSMKEEHYGDAILSRWPVNTVKAGLLPGLGMPGLEARGAIWSTIQVENVSVQVVNTHLSFLSRERHLQVQTLLGEQWLGHPECRDPVLLLGDFNATPRSATYRALTSRLRDSYDLARRRRSTGRRATFPTRYPALRLDYIFVGPSIKVQEIRVLRTRLARIASDHLPVVADLRLSPS
jgi:endonuclease/exonuclease/phosphatase family metal-dependent hydrolase